MRPSPEDAFDTWFRTLGFRGRDKLQDLPDSLRGQLCGLQAMYNDAFTRERTFPMYAKTLPLYFDFLDADVENAIATTDGEHYAFIGITTKLVFKISDLCILIARFDGPICRAFNLRPSSEPYNELQGALTYILLSFIVAHEWSHHKHGHLTQLSSPGKIFQEVVNTERGGSLDYQIKEIAADGYAAFLTLAHLFDDRRATFLPFLAFDPAPPQEALEQLFLALPIVAFGGFLLQLPAQKLDEMDLYLLTHPPASARLNFFVREVATWCSHNRPALEEWIMKYFQALLNATAEAVLGIPDFRHAWGAQIKFLHAPEGKEYDAALTAGIANYKKTLGDDTPVTDLLETPGELQLQLVPAADDAEFPTSRTELLDGLRDADVDFSTRTMAWGAVGSPEVTGILLVLASTLGPRAITELRKLLQTYLAHGGRKIKVKTAWISIECSPDDFQKLFTTDQLQQLLKPPPPKALPPKKKVKEEPA